MDIRHQDADNKAHEHGHVSRQAGRVGRVEAGAAGLRQVPGTAVADAGRLQVAGQAEPEQLVPTRTVQGLTTIDHTSLPILSLFYIRSYS